MLPGNLSFRELESLKVLSAVVQETLRMYPSAGFTRECATPCTVRTASGREVTLPPDSEIFFFPNIIQLDPGRVQNATSFRPDRWLEHTSEAKSSYFPFSSGARNCVGERLALAEIRVALALLLVEFQFQIKDDADAPFQVLLLSLQPHGVQLNVTPRDSSVEYCEG
jgi:cytochrome P450